jgi:hypothetical protein
MISRDAEALILTLLSAAAILATNIAAVLIHT